MSDEPDDLGQAFGDLWRAVEPRLRRRVLRFGLRTEDEVDELIAQVAVVLFRLAARGKHPLFASETISPGDFLRLADSVAWRIFHKQRSKQRRRDVLAAEAHASPALEWHDDYEPEERFERLEWHEALAPFLSGKRDFAELGLRPDDVEAVLLFLRGGPYSGAERQFLSRARRRLRKLFTKLFVGAGGGWSGLRARFRSPPPLVPATAAVLTGLTLGQFVPTGADTQPPPTVASATRPNDTPVAVPTLAPPAAAVALHGLTPESGGALHHPPGANEPSDTIPRPPVTVHASANLPQPGTPTNAELTVARDIPSATTWASASYNCDTAFRQHVCSVAAIVTAPAPSP